MEIRNTTSEQGLEWLDTPELLSQLLIGLRNVAVYEGYEPAPSDTFVKWIEFVQRVYRLLAGRSFDPTPGLQSLTAETGWQMAPLLDECMRWPRVSPQVREQDDIRRMQRCWHCKQREHPQNSVERLCDECLLRLADLITQRTPPEGIIFFRTYNASRWCVHANAETVLMTCDDYDFLADGRCEQCLRAEYNRRHIA